MTDPTITAPVTSPQNDWWRRAVRTLLQLIAGGGLAWLTDQLAVDLPAQYVPYVVGGYTVLVTLAQNALEDMGAMKPILKDKPSGGEGSSTPPEPEPEVDWTKPETWPKTPIGASTVKRDKNGPTV